MSSAGQYIPAGGEEGGSQEGPSGVDARGLGPPAVAGTEVLVGEALAHHDVPLLHGDHRVRLVVLFQPIHN